MPDSFDYTTGTNSENVRLLQALIDDAPEYTEETNSRNANILKSIINNTEYTDAPQSEIEELLLRLKAKIGGEIEVDELNVTENGTYDAGVNKAYNPVKVELPLSSKTITENGTYTASDDNLAGFNEVTVAVEGYAKKSIENTPTDIATFNASALPMPSLKIGIEAVQSGSGDPSPTNVRPISGWSACGLTANNVNMWGYGIGSADVTGTYWGWHIPYNTKATIKLFDKGNGGDISNLYFGFTGNGNDADGGVQWMIRAGVVENTTIETNEHHFVSIYQGNQEALDKLFNRFNVMVTIDGQPNTEYEPYNGQTYTVQFTDGDNPLTVYGGSLDVVSGVLTMDRAYVDMGTLNYIYEGTSTPKVFRAILSPTPKISGYTICSVYKGTSKGVGALDNGELCISGTQTYPFLRIRDDAYTDATAFKTSVNGQQLVYELATPSTIQLTPTQVKSLLGTNNLWADTGDVIEGEYFSKL